MKKNWKVILIVFFLFFVGNSFRVYGFELESKDILVHRSIIYNKDNESLDFFAINGFNFRNNHVLYDEDVTVNMYSKFGILVNLTTNEVIYERRADEKAYPASLTKMMTVLIGLENGNQETMMINVDFDKLAEAGAAIAGFKNGELVSKKDLLMATMLPSGADAALSLADQIAGSEEDFVYLMNKKAESLGMKNTHFTNVTGLHDDEHYTTARDLAILVKVALKNPEFKEIFSAKSYVTEKGSNLVFTSRMFDRMASPIFEGGEILGGKTGYTWEALLCLASFAMDDQDEYALITMHADGGPRTPQYHVKDAREVYKYFLNYR